MSHATQLLNAIEQGDARAADELLPSVYAELRRLAGHKMSQEGAGQALQATALVHEAYVRLVDGDLACEAPGNDLLALDEALARLEQESPDKAKLVKLRYFAGLTLEQAAEALKLFRATASRHWTYARAWLYDAISNE